MSDTVANPVGRPLKFTSVEEVSKIIEDYFIACTLSSERPMISGLAYALDTTRKTLLDYCNRGDEFSYTLNRAKLRCEMAIEKLLVNGDKNIAGPIFVAKNNFGWVEKTETDITSKGESIQAAADPRLGAEYLDFLKGRTQD